MRRLVLALSLLLPAVPALAQSAASPEQVAAARAEGDRLLADAGAQAFFRNESADGAIVLRHLPSGYRCLMNPGAPVNRVSLFPHPRPGHNVGCSSQGVAGANTFYLTHSSDPGETERLALDVAVAGIRERVRDAKPAPKGPARESGSAFPPGSPKPLVAVLRSARGDERVDVGKRGEWIVKYRYSAPPGLASEGGPLDIFWITAVMEGERYRAANPTPVTAAAAPADPAPARPRSIAEQRADAERLIEVASAAGVFTPEERDGAVFLRHDASGLRCLFERNGGKLMVADTPRRGDDVTCINVGEDARSVTHLRVERRRGSPALGRVLDEAVRQLRSEVKDLRPATGPGLSMRVEPRPGAKPMPAHRSVSLEGDIGREPTYFRVTAAVVGDWLLTQLSRGPAAERIATDLTSEVGFSAHMLDLLEGGRTGV